MPATESFASVRNLRLIRLYYFLWIGGSGFLGPFVSLFYKAQGLSGTEIGLLGTFGAITAMLAAPVWGRWGDRLHNPRRLIMIALLGSSLLALLRGIQSLFWSISLFIILDALINSGTGSLSSVQALAVSDGRKAGFGSIRLWGSLGWAAVTPLAGFFIERYGLYVPFAGYAAMCVAAVLALVFVRTPDGIEATRPARVPTSMRSMLTLLARSRTIPAMALAFGLLWLTTLGRSHFETLYMTELGAPAGLIGIVGTVSALFEVPFMLLADRLIHRHGAGRILRIAMLVQAVAFLPVILVPSIPSFFVLRILASIALSLNSPSYFGFLVENAPDDQGSTVVSLFDVTLRGGVSLAAAPLAGLVFDLLGAYWLYPIGLTGCLLAWLILQATAHGRQHATP